MHEMSLALSIVEQVREVASREEATRVLEVEIEVGSLAGVLADSLSFCLDAVGAAGGLGGTAFRIVEVPAVGTCQTCQAEFTADSYLASCPTCGSENVSLCGGRELKIRSLSIEG